MNMLKFYRGSLAYHRLTRLSLLLALLLLCAVVAARVGIVVGFGYGMSQLMFIPVLLAALVYGLPGGFLFACAGGIVTAPFMPTGTAIAANRGFTGWASQTAALMLIGCFGGFASQVMRKKLMRPRQQIRLDTASGLPNVRVLLTALEKLAQSKLRNATHILGVVTVYNSDEMSSAFGFGVMDHSVQKLAACATACLPHGAAVFRIGSEQIGFIAQTQEDAMQSLLARLNTALRQPLMHEAQPIHADTRIGYVAIPGFQEEPESYLRKAQAASLQASQSGHDISLYRSGICTSARDNLSILGELIGGMEREEVLLHYQPKVSLLTGEVVGVEALIRWQHPQRGMLPPSAFIQRAEQSTLIHSLTEFVLEHALRQAVVWRDAGMLIPIAVNVSPRNLTQPGLYSTVLRALTSCGAGAELLELEVTEGVMIADMDMVTAELQKLDAFGVKIAIDDFGTGYSSINHLDRLPASVLKIDQSFVRRILSDTSSVDIVDAVVSVAHKKGVHIVAEGVESQAVFDMLRELGCDVAQGYAIGKPMPVEEFENWYREWQTGASAPFIKTI
jgi:EAL domain-containing protein (putative c-di-GMP-specific phosphodiesterase class I)/GGDEF domain-containing protein